MSAAVKHRKVREAKAPVSVPAAAGPAPTSDTAPVAIYRPDCWGFVFWLGCIAVLVLLNVIDWVEGLLGH
jgi:hypothetical protein